MLNFFLIFHILITVFLIFFILLSRGKGSEVGALNTGNEFLSTRSSNSILNKVIILLAVLSLFSNFSINFVSKNSLEKRQDPLVNISKHIG